MSGEPLPAVDFDARGARNGFEPVATHLRYQPPQRSIDPDRSKGWMRRMLPVARSHRGLFITAIASALVMVVTRAIIPRYAGFAVNEALARPAGLREPLAPYLWVLLALTVTSLGSGFLNRYYLFRSAYALEFDLRALIYQHLTRLSFPFYDRVQSGQLISRANSDIRAVQMYFAFGPFVIVQFATVFVALWFMLQTHVGLTLVALLMMPFVYKFGVRMRQYMFPLSWIVQARMADTATIVDENLNGVRVVKSFAAEKAQIRVLARAAQRLRWVSTLQIRIRARFGPLMENLPRFGEALILLYGGLLVIDRRIGPGDILVFMAYLVMLQVPFRMMGFLLMMSQRAAASAQRIFEVLDEVPDISDRPGAIDLVDCRGEVEFRDVCFQYASGPLVLDQFNLHIPAGQTVAIVGRTGTGKTTIAKLLPRFYDIDDGVILIDGHDVRDLTQASLRAHIGLCFDEPFLFSAAIHDNIAYGQPTASRDDVVAAARIAGADEFIIHLEQGYDTVVGERGYTLSGGQRQRVAIARTILENPEILILDDATSAIDVKIELEIHDALRALMAGRTTLIIAHRLSTISLADRVVLLDGGVVIADGTHADLMVTEPRYAEVLAHLAEEDETKAESVAAGAAAHVIVDEESQYDEERFDGDPFDGEVR